MCISDHRKIGMFLIHQGEFNRLMTLSATYKREAFGCWSVFIEGELIDSDIVKNGENWAWNCYPEINGRTRKEVACLIGSIVN